MADGNTLTKMTPNLDIGAIPQWHIYDVAITAGEALTQETDLETLPVGTVILDYKLQCLVAETSATSTVAHVRLETGPIVLITGSADNAGTVDYEELESAGPNLKCSTWVSGTGLATENILQMQSVCVGTSVVGGTMRLAVLMCRVSRP